MNRAEEQIDMTGAAGSRGARSILRVAMDEQCRSRT